VPLIASLQPVDYDSVRLTCQTTLMITVIDISTWATYMK